MAKLIFAVVFATLVVSSLAVPVDNNGAEGQPEKKSGLTKLQSPLGARSFEDPYWIGDVEVQANATGTDCTILLNFHSIHCNLHGSVTLILPGWLGSS